MAEITVSVRDDDDSSVVFDCDIAGYFMTVTGGGSEVVIELDDKHLQQIIDKLAEWGWESGATEQPE